MCSSNATQLICFYNTSNNKAFLKKPQKEKNEKTTMFCECDVHTLDVFKLKYLQGGKINNEVKQSVRCLGRII